MSVVRLWEPSGEKVHSRGLIFQNRIYSEIISNILEDKQKTSGIYEATKKAVLKGKSVTLINNDTLKFS